MGRRTGRGGPGAAVVVAAGSAFPALLDHAMHPTPGRLVAGALLVAQALPLALAGRRPLPAFWSVAVVTAVGQLAAAQAEVASSVWAGLPFAVAAFVLASGVTRRRAVVHGAAVTGVFALGFALNLAWADPTWRGDPGVVLGALAPVAAWAVGVEMRARATEAALAEERARRLERAREGDLGTARAEERARIARDLHDAISHNLTLLVVRTEALRARAGELPAWAVDELTDLGGEGRRAMIEMRAFLGLLRADEEVSEGADSAHLTPVPGAGDLHDLLDRVRAAGAEVRVSGADVLECLPPTLSMTVYRVLQESLTNAQRHAPGAPVDVRLGPTPNNLVLRVENGAPPDGPLPVLPAGGTGIAGMRARVTALGGRIVAGPVGCGGFAVEAVLPLRARPGAVGGAT